MELSLTIRGASYSLKMQNKSLIRTIGKILG